MSANPSSTPRHSVNVPNIKLLLKDNHLAKKCYKCQQLNSFICEHSTKYRDEIKNSKTETGRFYLAAKAKISERRTSQNATSQTQSSIEDSLTSESASF